MKLGTLKCVLILAALFAGFPTGSSLSRLSCFPAMMNPSDTMHRP